MQCAGRIPRTDSLKESLHGRLIRRWMWCSGSSRPLDPIFTSRLGALWQKSTQDLNKIIKKVPHHPASRSYSTVVALPANSHSGGTGQHYRGHAQLNVSPSQGYWPQPPPRLATHSFLHARLRAGDYYDASRIAAKRITEGVRIRTTTLEIIVRSLCSDRVIKIAESNTSGGGVLKVASGFPKLQPDNFTHPSLRAAYELLVLVRQHKYPRTLPMYFALVNACIRRGELLNSSLLFALLVRDWKAYSTLKEVTHPDSTPPSVDTVTNDTDIQEMANGHQSPKNTVGMMQPPYPSIELLSVITSGINSSLSQDPVSPGDETYLQEPLQALAILVSLMIEGHMHFGKLASIFCAMYRSPRTARRVWVMKNGRPTPVNAYSHFHAFLMRIVGSFQGNGTVTLPPLDTRSYNTLLHYTLHHRRSPTLASYVLEHMCGRPERALKPTIETFNILTRSGTVLGQLDISNAALSALQRARNSANGDVVALLPENEKVTSPGVPELSRTTEKKRASHSSGVEKLKRQTTLLVPDRPLPADAYTLDSYISHLTSSRRPHLVADALMYALPELGSIDHPTWNSLRQEMRGDMLRQSRRMDLKRAASLGPHFYATVLDALYKARRTGLAERFWILATQAQRASWLPSFAPEVDPWVLSIHAYTSMLQCYRHEASRRLPPRVDKSDDFDWVPKADHHLRGWARFVYQRGQMQRSPRGINAEGAKLLRFRSMLSGGEGVYWALQEVGSAPELRTLELVPPSADSLFFTVALRLFSLRPAPDATKYKRGQIGHEHSTSTRWTPMVQRVAEAMVSAGYPVPADLRALFVGRWEPGTRDFGPPPTLDRSPYASQG